MRVLPEDGNASVQVSTGQVVPGTIVEGERNEARHRQPLPCTETIRERHSLSAGLTAPSTPPLPEPEPERGARSASNFDGEAFFLDRKARWNAAKENFLGREPRRWDDKEICLGIEMLSGEARRQFALQSILSGSGARLFASTLNH
ncbi:hypothetical protein IB223_13025 [Pseudoxanthomonas sp. PXM03]|uniref:hypothetical protein n=1 Tax=Pseudoxanthomonas sp. PXM03 TaxID=2769284 RepID=UPI00177DE615|nr:hypothetical protein [Pseudoxanthomonas sp. PXM03]MBD9437019.1 hypothetical protein [Pseudoxanthomonas sp. PXM03]